MTDLPAAIRNAFDYLTKSQVEIPHDILLKSMPHLKGVFAFDMLNALYHNTITDTLIRYFEGGSIVTARNAFKRAMVEAFGSAFDAGWLEAGNALPASAEALAWLNARVNAEMGYIDMLFQQAKELRKEEGFDYFAWIVERANGYTTSVSGTYNAAIMWGKKSQMLFWRLGQTEKHCETCLKLDGDSHRASWYLNRNYIPRTPGASMDCGGYHCDCRLEDKDGHEVTI